MTKKRRRRRRLGNLSTVERHVLQQAGLIVLRGSTATPVMFGDAYVTLNRRKLVKHDGTLTTRGRRIAVARAAQAAAQAEHHLHEDERYDATLDALENASGTWDENDCPEWLWEDMPDEKLLARVKALREARAAYDNYVQAPAPRLTQRQAEVWLMQRKLEGKLEDILEYA